MTSSPKRRVFVAAAALALLAGYVDGFAFSYLGGFFVSFMSGNTTQAGVELAHGALPAAGFAASLVVAFVGGASIGFALSTPRPHSDERILAVVLAGLACATASAIAGWTLLCGMLLAAAMGAVNAVFARGGSAPYAITYMTGALIKIAQGAVTAARGGPRTQWIRPLLLWTAIAAGAVAGAGGYLAFGTAALALGTAALAIALIVALAVGTPRRR